MTRASDAALRAYARLRHADFTQAVQHLKDSQAEALKKLKRARGDDAVFLQGQIDVYDTILQNIEEGENLLFTRNHGAGSRP